GVRVRERRPGPPPGRRRERRAVARRDRRGRERRKRTSGRAPSATARGPQDLKEPQPRGPTRARSPARRGPFLAAFWGSPKKNATEVQKMWSRRGRGVSPPGALPRRTG